MEERCCSNPSPTSLSKPSFQFWKFSCFKWPYLPFLRLAHRRFTSEELSHLLNILNCLEYVSFEVSILCIHSKGRLQYYCKKHHSQSRISLHTSVWSSLDSHSFACKASGEFAIWAENIQKYAEGTYLNNFSCIAWSWRVACCQGLKLPKSPRILFL